MSNVSQEGMLSQTCGRRKDLKVAQLAFWVFCYVKKIERHFVCDFLAISNLPL